MDIDGTSVCLALSLSLCPPLPLPHRIVPGKSQVKSFFIDLNSKIGDKDSYDKIYYKITEKGLSRGGYSLLGTIDIYFSPPCAIVSLVL